MKTVINKLLLIILLTCFLKSARAQNSLPVNTVKPEIALIGIHIMNIYGVDMATNSFYADFYLWCRWKGAIDPLKNIEFTNSEEQWGFSKSKLYETDIALKDSILYNILHVQGKFHHTFILDRYPLDKQVINMVLENSIHTSGELLYTPDTVNSHMQPDILIPGWEMNNFNVRSTDHVYVTNFGLPENVDNNSYSNMSFSLTLKRPVEYFLWKLLLPLIIVLLSGLGATLIYPAYIDARIYAPIGALLTTVFLQQSYSSSLPDISYLILTDKVYVIVYISILAGIFQAIFTANLVRDGSEESFKRAKKLDRRYALTIIVFLFFSTMLLIIQ